MFFTHESLNILSLLALMISVGLLVDNSVVVTENIFRKRKSTADAAAAVGTAVQPVGGQVIGAAIGAAIGIAVDYAFHFLAHSFVPGWSRSNALGKVFRGLSLGFLFTFSQHGISFARGFHSSISSSSWA